MRGFAIVLLALLLGASWAQVDDRPDDQAARAELREREVMISVDRAEALAAYPALAERAGELAEKRKQAFRQQYQSERMPSFPSRWSLELSYRLGSVNSRWATLLERGYEYTGGAHGMPIEQRHTWLVEQQRWITIEDVLTHPDAFREVADFVRSTVLARRLQRYPSVEASSLQAWQQALDTGAPAESSAWQRFELLAEGDKLKAVRFIILPYVIGPFAEGVHVIDMPAYLLQPWLAEGFQPVAGPQSSELVRRWGHFQPDQAQALWRDCGEDTPSMARLHMSPAVAAEVDRLLQDGASSLFIDGLWQGERRLVGALRIEMEGHGCELDLAGLQWRAFGNEPFWSARLSKVWLEWQELGSEPRRRKISKQSGQHHWQLEQGGEFTVLALPCRDSMSGTYFAYTALLQSPEGETRKGCAVPGSRD